jgi:hypothetical protein
MLARVGEQGDVAGALDGPREHALVLGTGRRPPSGQDATAFVDVLPEQRRGLVVDALDFFDAELADAVAAPRPTATWPERPAAVAIGTTTVAV